MEHDPSNCNDGEGCRPCKVAEAKAKLRQLAATKKIAPEDRARALAGVIERAKRLIDGAGPVLALVLVCFGLAGCVAPEAIEQARTEGAACHGLAVLPLNNREVRQVAARQAVAWQRQHEALTGEPIPGSEAWLAIPADVLAPAEPPR